MPRFVLMAASIAFAAAVVPLFPAAAQNIEPFFKGKTITIIVGVTAGGGYDLNARLLARHMGAHIPGNPTIVVQNMPGAGSMTAANYMYAVAPRDGTAFGTTGRIALVEPIFTKQSFDSSKFNWVGSISRDVSTCISWKTSAVKTFDDLLTKPFLASGQAKGADPDAFANMLNNLFGAKIRLVTGYPGTNEQSLSMERGETDGFCGISYSTLKSRRANWIENGTINILVQNAVEKHPDLPNVPLITDLAKDPDTQRIVRLIVATQLMARPFFAPPGMSEERAATLRKAFDDTMTDPEFLADAKKSDIEVSPLRGEEIDALIKDLYATPRPLVERAARAMSSQ